MPEIELPPGKYRWRRPLSKPLAWAFVAVALGLLGYLFWTRDDGSVTTLFWATVVVAVPLGLILGELLRDLD